MKRIISLLVLVSVVTGCGNLKVTRLDPNKPNEGGIPYYMPRQDFVVTELGIDEKGNATSDVQLRVDLVTQSDLSRGFLVRNSPAPFGNSEFEIIRDGQGKLLTIMARSEDKSKETVEAIVSLAIKAAAFAGAEQPAQINTLTVAELTTAINSNLTVRAKIIGETDGLKADLKKPGAATAVLEQQIKDKQTEIASLTQEITKLAVTRELLVLRAARDAVFDRIQSLAAIPASFDPDQLKSLQENLEKLNDHIAALEKDPNASPPKGVTKSNVRPANVIYLPRASAVLDEASKLDKGEVGIYIVPRS